MAGNASKKPGRKGQEKAGCNRSRDNLRDELDLRDEIFELKKEIAALRKERDRLLIRTRKCEDEAKRKDRQIEQLMDPSQNSEIRRLLSMKGAAILLNLKDQNNTLLHMVMDKDLQIRRLLAEIKTAKLYSRSSKAEPYRAEIARLRALLLQSQEALKEAAVGPQVSSMLAPDSSSSSSSSQPTPRQLEELRFTVQSLETHMRYSKELINKKNQEINVLSHQLEKILQGRRSGIEPDNLDWLTAKQNYPEQTFVFDKDNERRKSLELFRKQLPKSLLEKALTEPKLDKLEKVTKRNSLPCLYTAKDDIILKKASAAKNVSINEKEPASLDAGMFSKSLKWKNGKCKESLPDVMESTPDSSDGKTFHAKRKKSSGREKWRNAVKKLRKSSKGKNEIETNERKMKIADDSLGDIRVKSKKRIMVNNRVSDQEIWAVIQGEMRKTSLDSLECTPLVVSRKLSLPMSLDEKIQSDGKMEVPPIPVRRSKIGGEVTEMVTECDEIITLEEAPSAPMRQKIFRSLYRGSIDSSLESETSSMSRLEPKSFEVEVEINNPRFSISIDSEKSSPIKNIAKKEGGENYFAEDNFEEEEDDDNDVVTV